MTFKKRNFLAFLTPALLVFASLLNSCNEDPTNLGFSLIKDTVAIVVESGKDSIYITSAEPYLYNPETFNPGAVLIGKYGDYKSSSLVRFANIPDTLDDLSESDILSAELIVYPLNYAYGDFKGTNLLSFKVKPVIKYWDNKLATDQFYSDNSMFDNKVVAQWSGSIKLKDSTMDPINMPLDKGLVLDWLKKTAGKKDTIWGLAFLPDDNSTVINRFAAQGSGALDYARIKIVCSTAPGIVDTIYFTSAIDKYFLMGKAPENNKITIEGGRQIRSRLNFDITTIPTLAGIHRAELELTMDAENSYFGSSTVDSVIRVDYFESASDEKLANPLFYFFMKRESSTSNKYIAKSLAPVFSQMLVTGRKGYIVFRFDEPISELNSANKIVFHGPADPDASKRPKLRLIYSLLDNKNSSK